MLREEIAKAYGLILFAHYIEEVAADKLGIDHTTLKRRRRAGKVPHVKFGDRGVRYFGYQIADMLIGEMGGPDADPTPTDGGSNGGGQDGEAKSPLAGKPHPLDVARLAKEAFKKKG